jgi:hypothetical protein
MNDNSYDSTPISGAYAHLKAINLGRTHVTEARLTQGPATIRIAGLDGFFDEGSLQRSGVITGLSKTYRTLDLKEGQSIKFKILGPNDILVLSDKTASAEQRFITAQPATDCIFSSKKLRPVHIERFHPENLLNWTPTAEVDVYMAFGVLESMTGYKYCCGINAALLGQLGYSVDPKPDAVLIDDETDEYRIAEFEVYSSSFAKHGHKPEQVDVLVAWIDDEKDRAKLPRKVVPLQEIARSRALQILAGADLGN